jgi:Domain of unknown function (DUF4440)
MVARDAEPFKAVSVERWEDRPRLLAPEFQILRSGGKGYDKAEYLAGGMSKIDSIVSVRDVVATAHGDLMVVRYVISLKASADGAAMKQRLPRLSMPRRDGDR